MTELWKAVTTEEQVNIMDHMWKLVNYQNKSVLQTVTLVVKHILMTI